MKFYHKIPLYGRLFSAGRKSVNSSIKELLIGTMFSTLPLWFFPLAISFLLKDSPGSFVLIKKSLERGDLFIYSAALIGPLIYLITKRYVEIDNEESADENDNRLFGKINFEFPYGASFFIIAILICMVAAICFGFSNLNAVKDINVVLNTEFLFYFSIFIYIFSLSCLFSVSVYRNELENIGKNLGNDEREFLKKWQNRDE